MPQSNDPEFAVFGIIPTDEEKKRREDPNADPTHFHGGVYQTMAVNELDVLYDALRLIEDPEYAAECNARMLQEAIELGVDVSNGIPPLPSGKEAETRRAELLAEIRRVKARQAPRLNATGLERGGG